MHEYAELKCKTNFSFLMGASHPEELVETAAKLKLKALAITDKDGVYGIPKAYHMSKSYSDLKLITGADVTFENHPGITFLAKDRAAYGLLCRLLTESHTGQEKGKAALKWEKFLSFMSEKASSGLFALPDVESQTRYDVLKDIFGNRLYLPIFRVFDGLDEKRWASAREVCKKLDLPMVATNDVHYHIKERRPLQDVLTATRLNTSIMEGGYRLFPNSERHLKSPDEMHALFKDCPEALWSTLEIAEQCTFSPSQLRYQYPSEWIPQGKTAHEYLVELTWQGASQRFPQGVSAQVKTQIEHELTLIKKLGFADYFLTIYEIICFAESKKILFQGRGSAANSVVCYCLRITAIDPTQINLLFERFISAERGEPPDIDVDFEHERREEVIQHIYEKYGRHRAAMVSAVVTYRTRSALREVSKALGVDVGTLSAKKLMAVFDEKIKEAGLKNIQPLIESLTEELEGFPRHLSIHSGGFTLSAEPITEIVPVEPARMEGRTIIQWDKYDLDYIGLLKIDVLSLGMLTALRKILDQVGLKLHSIPHDDKKTYEMIQKADTVGTFQIESRAQISMLGRLLPKKFYDLVIEVAIVRPGPTQGHMVHPYLKRRNGLEEVNYYGDERVKNILEKTLGVPLFQEQVMQMAITLANFKPGEADELRRAVNAWRSTGGLDKLGRKLMKGLMEGGLPQEFAERIFSQIQGFSSYGFPESHAASFALLAYASAYLKCHYPAEFTWGLINSQPMGFYSIHTLIDDAKRHGIKVFPLDPNISQWDSTLEDGGIRLGFHCVKGLGKEIGEKIIAEAQGEPFQNLNDFLARTQVRKDILHRLAMADCFSLFKYDQRHTLWQMLESELLIEQCKSQLSLFTTMSYGWNASSEETFNTLEAFERIQKEYDAYGLSTTNHPMVELRKQIPRLPQKTVSEIKAISQHGQSIRAAGLILVRQRPPTAKGVTFSTLEDESGFLDLIFHPQAYETYRDIFLENCFLDVVGKIQKEGNTVSVLVKSVRPLFKNDKGLVIEPQQYFVAL